MIIDLKYNVGEGMIDFLFEKPLNFEAFCKKWRINDEEQDENVIHLCGFEYYLSKQLSNFIFNDISADVLCSAMLKLDIPSGIPLRMTLHKGSDSDFEHSLSISLLNPKVSIQKEKGMPF